MKILLTTSSDDNLWPLSQKTIPHLLKSIKWKYDYYHFHDGDIEKCREICGNNVVKIEQPNFKVANATNNVYRCMVEFIRKNGYDRWMHFDGDVFVCGSDPEAYIDYVVKEDRLGTRLQPHGVINLLPDGTPRFAIYENITSSSMYVSAEDAIAKCDDVIYKKNVPWTYECALKADFSLAPYKKYPMFFFTIHCHVPHDRAHGSDRLNRLNKFLTNYYAHEDFKYRDPKKVPDAPKLFYSMLDFRTKIVGNLFAVDNDLIIRDRKDRQEYIINFEDYARKVAESTAPPSV